MNPAELAVRRWQFTLLTFALLAVLGLGSFLSIPRTEDPHFPFPIYVINVGMPGADPADMEQLVAKPIEDAVDSLDEIKHVRSTASDGFASVVAEFDWSVDADRKFDEVSREVNNIRPNLPAGVTHFEIRRIRPSEAALIQTALVSDTLPWHRFEQVARDLRERLERVPGIQRAQVWGAPKSEMQVAVDLGKLAALKLPVTAVTDALKAAGVDAPVGAVHAGNRRFNVKTLGAFRSPEQVAETPIRAVGPKVVRVKDVATVGWGTDEPAHLTYYNGKRAIFVTAEQKENLDALSIAAAANKELDAFAKTLPASVKLERGFDQSDNVKHRLGHLYRDFGIALGLVMITLLPLGPRAALVVLVSIPMSLLIAVMALQGLGYSLNQLSITGFVLALGLLVDDSIVVTENIARKLREGYTRRQAAIGATAQIGVAVLGCTATLMLAFVPLLFLPEGAGMFIRSLPVTVLLTIGASLFVSLTIIPFLASRILKETDDPEGNPLLKWVTHGIERFYRPILHRSLEKPWQSLAIIGVVCLTALPIVKVIGTSLFPPADTRQFLISIEMPDGAALKSTEKALRFVERDLAKRPEIEFYMGNLGHGNPKIFYNQFPHESSPNFAELYVALKTWEGSESLALMDEMRKVYRGYPGADIKVKVFENGPPILAPIEARISGPDVNVLKQLAAKAEAILKDVPGTRDVENPMRLDRTDLNLGIDEAKASALGVPAGAARRVARLALSGEQAARYRDTDGEDFPVTVRLPLDGRHDLDALKEIYVPTASGTATPLGTVANPHLETGPSQISRYSKLRTVTIRAWTRTGHLTSKVTVDAFDKLNSGLGLPPGYKVEAGGQVEAEEDSFAGLGGAGAVAFFGILAVLTLEFGKFRTVAVVAGVIPLGLFGATAALFLTGYSLSFTATIGIIALIGIEIKNSILLVDFTEQLRDQGMGLREAIEQAGEVRFLPVLLTSVTAIFGMLPLALEGSGLYSPLAITIIGGLITSTLLSRIATPTMYLLLSRKKVATTPMESEDAVLVPAPGE